jgi:GTPase SAR1 family protein
MGNFSSISSVSSISINKSIEPYNELINNVDINTLNETNKKTIDYKICILGCNKSGKSSYLQRVIRDLFDGNTKETVYNLLKNRLVLIS